MKKLQIINDLNDLSKFYQRIVKEDFNEMSMTYEELFDTLNGCPDAPRKDVAREVNEIAINIAILSKQIDSVENLLLGKTKPMKFLNKCMSIKKNFRVRICQNKALPLHK